jgi:hypothetical protein
VGSTLLCKNSVVLSLGTPSASPSARYSSVRRSRTSLRWIAASASFSSEGGSGDDYVRVIGTGTMLGGPGDDAFDKVPCRDRCLPPDNGEGPRVIRGGAGNDVLRLFGPHDDTVYLTDGERDRVISCGPGTDTIYLDRGLDKIRAGASCGDRHPQ